MDETTDALIEIKVDGQLLGTIDPYTLKGKAQFELERCNTALKLLTWLETYASGNAEEAEAILGELPVQDLLTLVSQIGTAMGEALRIPKRNGTHSGSASKVARGRHSGRA